MRSRPFRAALARAGDLALGVALIAVLGWPALATVVAALGTEPGGVAVDSGGVRRPIGLAIETVRLVVATEALALPAGVALALALFRTDAWGRRGMLGLLAVAAFVPMPLHATAWLGAVGNLGRSQVFGARPILTGWPGAAFVHAAAALPWVVVLTGVGLRAVEPELEESALLDLPAWRVAWRVTLRRGVGAIAGAALAVAVLTAGDMTVTDLLRVRTYAEEAYLQYQLGNGPAAAGAVALPTLVVLGGLIAAGARAVLAADPSRWASASGRARVWRLGGWRFPVGLALLAVVGVGTGLPLFSVIWRAGRVGGAAASGRPPHWSASGFCGTMARAWDETSGPLAQTATLAALGASLAVALAWALAWKCRDRGPWRFVTAGSVALALAAPGPVMGMALVYAYRSAPIIYDTSAIVVLAAVARTFPFALLVVWPAVRLVARAALDAAAVDGLGEWGQAWQVALPTTRAAVVAAWGVAFVLAVGELPATNLVAPPGVTPLSVVIWGLLHTGVESHLAGVVLVMLAAVSMAGLAAAAGLARIGRS